MEFVTFVVSFLQTRKSSKSSFAEFSCPGKLMVEPFPPLFGSKHPWRTLLCSSISRSASLKNAIGRWGCYRCNLNPTHTQSKRVPTQEVPLLSDKGLWSPPAYLLRRLCYLLVFKGGLNDGRITTTPQKSMVIKLHRDLWLKLHGYLTSCKHLK